jgi:secreted trypsin-like serine protease
LNFSGPLTAEIFGRTTQVGLVSFGQFCADPKYPGVYARVTDNIDWIFANSDALNWQCSH